MNHHPTLAYLRWSTPLVVAVMLVLDAIRMQDAQLSWERHSWKLGRSDLQLKELELEKVS